MKKNLDAVVRRHGIRVADCAPLITNDTKRGWIRIRGVAGGEKLPMAVTVKKHLVGGIAMAMTVKALGQEFSSSAEVAVSLVNGPQIFNDIWGATLSALRRSVIKKIIAKQDLDRNHSSQDLVILTRPMGV